ncbi:MAG: phosphatase, partial [Gammaproteobacteria bacterium]|nr:phosphatase [Gammaproteobacteria bacterium]
MLIRTDRQLNIIISALTLLITASPVPANEPAGEFVFTPLTSSADINNWNPSAPWKLPAGFSQTLVSDENDLNIYDKGRNDWTDMNTVNETGSKAGRFLYRTHEMRHTPEGAAVSVVDLQSGKAMIVAQGRSWRAIDGIRWTPWGSLLIGEEKQEGRLFEIILDDSLTTGKAVDRPAAG